MSLLFPPFGVSICTIGSVVLFAVHKTQTGTDQEHQQKEEEQEPGEQREVREVKVMAVKLLWYTE